MSLEDLTKHVVFSKLRIIKNLLVVSFAYCLFFIGFGSLTALQSTINKEKGLGSLSQGVIFGIYSISSMIFPKYVIQKLGCKNTMLVSLICCIPWMASNFYPHEWTLLPSALLNGMGASLIWSSQCTYFNKASLQYCSLINSGKKNAKSSKHTCNKSNSVQVYNPTPSKSCQHHVEDIKLENADIESSSSFDLRTVNPSQPVSENSISRKPTNNSKEVTNHEIISASFFGLYSLIFRSSDIFGNLLSFFVLKNGVVDDTTNQDSSSCSCGPYFCNGDSPPGCLYEDTSLISDETRYLLTGICCSVSLAGIFLLIFGLDQIESTNKETVKISADMMLATWNQNKKKQQIYLVPITFLMGLSQGFFFADVTQAYIGCTLGTEAIGIVSIAFGASSAIVSPLSGWLVKHMGRIPVLLTGVVTAIGTSIWSLVWMADASKEYELYLMAVLWGLVIGSTGPQLPALYGILFIEDQEAAFATLSVWRGMGLGVSFLYSSYLCTYLKIYILMSIALISIVGYLLTEKDFVLIKKKRIEMEDP